MNEAEIEEAVSIADELVNRIAIRGFQLTGVLYGHGKVVAQYTHRGKCGQFTKKVRKHVAVH